MRKDAGVDGDAQRISQLVWMIFLKVLDDREKEREALEEGFKSPIPRELRWRTWAENPAGMTGDGLLQFVDGELFPKLKILSAAGRNKALALVIRGVFEDAYNYMKSGTLLRQVVNKLNEVDLNRSADRHEIGAIYEKLRSDLQNAGNAGEFYTPRAVTQFAVDMVNPKLGETILDPACGTGGFLTCAIERLRKQAKDGAAWESAQECLRGIEKKPLPHLLCVTNMILHGVDVPSQIRHDNALQRPLKDYGAGDQVRIVMTNPPFGGMEEDGIENNFPPAFQGRETADLFLLLIMTILEPKGRAAIVLPDGTLFGEGIKTRLKEKLLAECNLHTIVRLPKGVFGPYTGIKTNAFCSSPRAAGRRRCGTTSTLILRGTRATRRASRSGSRSSTPRRPGGRNGRRTEYASEGGDRRDQGGEGTTSTSRTRAPSTMGRGDAETLLREYRGGDVPRWRG